MSVTNLNLFHSDGRLRGTYVYMLLCMDDGPIYVKIGISDNPTERFQALRRGCPVRPRRFAFVEVRSRKKARKVEADLHDAMSRWNAHLEWFMLSKEERGAFNDTWKAVFEKHAEVGWPLKWEQIAVDRLIALGEQRQRFFRRQYAARGKAYRDFIKDCASETPKAML